MFRVPLNRARYLLSKGTNTLASLISIFHEDMHLLYSYVTNVSNINSETIFLIARNLIALMNHFFFSCTRTHVSHFIIRIFFIISLKIPRN